eukprot:1066463-Alexandrium_andersonii.AAC.1
MSGQPPLTWSAPCLNLIPLNRRPRLRTAGARMRRGRARCAVSTDQRDRAFHSLRACLSRGR